jgi:hypothetical protein
MPSTLARIGAFRRPDMVARPVVMADAVAGPAAAPVAAATIAPEPGTAAPTRPVSEAVALRPALSRDARMFARPRLDEARIINPALFEKIRPIQVRPVPTEKPGCAAGGEHEQGQSANYTVPTNRPGAVGQSNWRWCRKCQGLAFGGHAGGVCVKGETHDFSQSGDYVLQHGTAPAGHQTNWRWCRKCDGLAFGGGTGACPAGGAHDHTGSGDYALAMDQPDAEGQPNWRWCSKCQSLAYAGGAVGASREELALPVAASDPIDENAAFEAATGADKYYLSRYRLASRLVSGSQEYRIRMAAGEDGAWTLQVTLDRIRPDGIPADATELDHELLLQLAYRLTTSDGSAITKTLDFTEIGETEDRSAIVARLRFASPAERDQALAAITSPGAGCGIIAIRSVRVAVPIPGSPDRYRPVTRGLRQVVEPDPLFLNPTLHPYLYDGARPAGGRAPGLEARQLKHGANFHTYWVDATDPAHVYYLPDAFRLARREKPGPFTPLITVRPVQGTTPDAEPMMAFEFVATPWIDTARLETAKREFAKALPQPAREDGNPLPTRGGLGGMLGSMLGEAIGGAAGGAISSAVGSLLGVSPDEERAALIRMEPLPSEKASFWLALPGASGGGLVERPSAQIDVRTAVIVAETLPMADFQAVYDALMGGAVAIMKGEVRVELRPGAIERLPFEGRFDRMNGELMDAVITPGAQSGQFTIALTNAIESTLEVSGISASLLTRGIETGANAAFSTQFPLKLAPGETLMMNIASKRQLPTPLPGGLTVEPLLDFRGVKVLPDSEAIWKAIFDADVSIEAQRTVRVKLFPGMFDAPSGNAADRAMAIVVQFEGGSSVELTPDKPEGAVKLSAPIADVMLKRAGGGGYRYKSQIFRRNSRPADSEWRSDNADLLIPMLPEG